MRQLLVILWLAGTGGLAVADEVPLPRARPSAPALATAPHPVRTAAAVPGVGPTAAPNITPMSEPTECDLRLARIAAIEPMPPVIGPGACRGGDMVRLYSVLMADGERVAVKPAPYLTCAMAEQLALWLREEAAPRFAAAGPALREVTNYDDFDCRGRNRKNGAKLSEHGKGNAIDIRGFHLAGGHFVMPTDTAAPKVLREDLRRSACARFSTVLGPGSDGHHEGHIHLDFAERRSGYRLCAWDVREPAKPQIAGARVPLPLPRPAIVDRQAEARKL